MVPTADQLLEFYEQGLSSTGTVPTLRQAILHFKGNGGDLCRKNRELKRRGLIQSNGQAMVLTTPRENLVRSLREWLQEYSQDEASLMACLMSFCYTIQGLCEDLEAGLSPQVAMAKHGVSEHVLETVAIVVEDRLEKGVSV